MFSLEVIGASRFQPIEGGYRRLHREVGLYTDLRTGEVMSAWTNPMLDREVEVIHIQNDPVNFPYTVDQQSGPFRILHDDFGDLIAFHREIPLRYPSALPRKEYPLHSAGDWYEAAELFNSFAWRDELDDESLTSVREFGTWSRVGPWLPWMEMEGREGMIVLVSQGRSTLAFGDLPQPLRGSIENDYPFMKQVPAFDDERPFMTSWDSFKKWIDEKRSKQ